MNRGDPLPELVIDPVDPEKMKTMAALLRDPNPIHWDVDVVRQLGMGDRPVNQGPNNMAYLVNLLAAFAGGYERVRVCVCASSATCSPAIASSPGGRSPRSTRPPIVPVTASPTATCGSAATVTPTTP